jgi:hypothetical protein
VAAGLRGAVTLTTAVVPPGWLLDRSEQGHSDFSYRVERRAALELHRARVQLEVSAASAAGGDFVALAAAQRRFYAHLRTAADDLRRASGPSDAETGPDGQSLVAWELDLRDRNQRVAIELGYDAIRAQAADLLRPPLSTANTNGTGFPSASDLEQLPGIVVTFVSDATGPPPRLQLVPDRPPQEEARLHASVQWLAVLGVLWLLSFFPMVLALARAAWPEQLALLGLGVAWVLASLPLAVGSLLAYLLARTFLLLRWLRGRTVQRRPPSVRGAVPAG